MVAVSGQDAVPGKAKRVDAGGKPLRPRGGEAGGRSRKLSLHPTPEVVPSPGRGRRPEGAQRSRESSGRAREKCPRRAGRRTTRRSSFPSVRNPSERAGGSGSARVPSLGFDQLIPDPPAPGARGKDPTGQGATRGRSHPRLGGGGGGCSPRVSESRIRGGERDARSTRKPWLHGGAASESNEFLAAGAGMAPGVAESAARRPWKPLAQGTGKKEGSTPRNCGVPLTRRKLGCYSGLCRRENNSVGGTRAGRAESELTPTSAHRSAAGRLYAIQKVGS
uniref:uncharacterized protein LOC114673011 n=1 Tax=Macaca mulatta TaxID=9544 RepID=UPI0010A2A030|nr:uncharacterized protein LOC114673011 [Macaca mulatta]